MIYEHSKLLKTQKEQKSKKQKQKQKKLSWGKMGHAQVENAVINKIASID